MSAFRESLAWAAGLFDGEGWCSSARYSRASGGMTATITLGVGQADRRVLDRFKSALGFGSVTGPVRSRKTLMWCYRAHGFERVQAAFAMLWPWLGDVKRAQMVRALRDALAYKPRQKKRLFSITALKRIRRALSRGTSQAAVARSLGCDRQAINRIARGRAYRRKS